MAEVIHREVTLTGPDAWQRVVDAVRPNAQSAIERGHPLHVVVTSVDADRLDEQVSFYWAVVLKRIAEDIPDDNGEFRPSTYWHEKLALEFLGMVEVANKRTGQLHRRRASIARGEITVGGMFNYTTRVQAWAANLGIDWD